MSFGFTGKVSGDVAAEHIDALGAYGPEDSAGHIATAKDAVKLILSRVWQGKDVLISTSGHINEDGTGYVSISISASNPAPADQAPVVVPAVGAPVVAPEPVVEAVTPEPLQASAGATDAEAAAPQSQAA